MQTELTEKEAEQILTKLDDLDGKIDEIQRNVRVMMRIHEMLHPEELERAREGVDRD